MTECISEVLLALLSLEFVFPFVVKVCKKSCSAHSRDIRVVAIAVLADIAADGPSSYVESEAAEEESKIKAN